MRRRGGAVMAVVLALAACGGSPEQAAVPSTALLPAEPVAAAVAATPPPLTTIARVVRPAPVTLPVPTVPPPTTAPPTTAPPTTAPATSPPPPPTTAAPAPAAPGAALRSPVPPPPPQAREPEVVLGSIEIPKLGVSERLLSGITMPTLDKGPGHWPGTALPGQPGNAVIAGHRTSKSRPFRFIDRLVEGDEIVITTGGVRHTYRVTGHEIVTPDALWILDQNTPAPTVTLFACHPPGSVAYRWVTRAVLVTG